VLAKVSDGGARPAVGAETIPVKLMVCGLKAALSARLTPALSALVWLGVKVTLIVHLAPTATLEPQVLVWAKSALLAPMIVKLVKLKAATPVLVSVTTCGAVAVPTAGLLNERELDERLTVVVAITTSTQ
jgi:hypothetical protein